ncbi:MAG TPA: hypothetical protein VE715_10085 [Blastocatellia bacterium]|nr:hypothetical protein [Blastocatellia bacterium]
MKKIDRSQARESKEGLVAERTFSQKPIRWELPPTPLPCSEASQPVEAAPSFLMILGAAGTESDPSSDQARI